MAKRAVLESSCVCVLESSCVCVCVGVKLCVCVGVRLCVCVGVRRCVCVGVRLCVCVGVRLCVCVGVKRCVCVLESSGGCLYFIPGVMNLLHIEPLMWRVPSLERAVVWSRPWCGAGRGVEHSDLSAVKRRLHVSCLSSSNERGCVAVFAFFLLCSLIQPSPELERAAGIH